MKIIGFGACLIDGFPHKSEVSFFNQLISKLTIDNKNSIYDKHIVSLGGFPITRAKKYINKKVVDLKPDLVIIQFGTTDVDIKIMKTLSKRHNFKYSTAGIDSKMKNIQPLEYNFIDSIKYFFKSLIKYLLAKILRIYPITTIDKYIISMKEMVDILNKNNIKVVVLAPFIQLDYFTNFRINIYIKELSKLRKDNNFYLVNCNEELSRYDKREVYLFDGIHLTEKGHSIVANKLKEALVNEKLV